MSRNQVIFFPVSQRINAVKRAVRRSHMGEVALVLPENTASTDAMQSLLPIVTELVRWTREQGKDMTIVGGTAELRAAAVIQGLRVATDVPAWQQWLHEAERQMFRHQLRLQVNKEWSIISQQPIRADVDAPPAYVSEILADAGIVLLSIAAIDTLDADERYEDSIILTVWETGLPDDFATGSNG